MSRRNDIRLLLSWIGAIVVYSSGAIVHLWTIIVAFIEGGVYYAIPTALLPCIAWIYWFVEVINRTGTVMNPYCITNIIMYPLCCGVIIFGAKLFILDSAVSDEITVTDEEI